MKEQMTKILLIDFWNNLIKIIKINLKKNNYENLLRINERMLLDCQEDTQSFEIQFQSFLFMEKKIIKQIFPIFIYQLLMFISCDCDSCVLKSFYGGDFKNSGIFKNEKKTLKENYLNLEIETLCLFFEFNDSYVNGVTCDYIEDQQEQEEEQNSQHDYKDDEEDEKFGKDFNEIYKKYEQQNSYCYWDEDLYVEIINDIITFKNLIIKTNFEQCERFSQEIIINLKFQIQQMQICQQFLPITKVIQQQQSYIPKLIIQSDRLKIEHILQFIKECQFSELVLKYNKKLRIKDAIKFIEEFDYLVIFDQNHKNKRQQFIRSVLNQKYSSFLQFITFNKLLQNNTLECEYFNFYESEEYIIKRQCNLRTGDDEEEQNEENQKKDKTQESKKNKGQSFLKEEEEEYQNLSQQDMNDEEDNNSQDEQEKEEQEKEEQEKEEQDESE